MECDIQLQNIMNRLVGVARVVIPDNQWGAETLRNSFLLLLAGHGLVKLELSPTGEPTWSATEELIEADNSREAGQPIMKELFVPSANNRDIDIMPSLHIVIEAMLPKGPLCVLSINKDDKRNKEERVLLLLAGLSLAVLMPQGNGDLAWAGTPQLLLAYNAYKERNPQGDLSQDSEWGELTLIVRSNSKVRMDDLLTEDAQMWHKIAYAETGIKLDKQVTAMTGMMSAETIGDAVAYRDFDGQIAWKASERYRRACTEDGQ
jgi:hypothetical protein